MLRNLAKRPWVVFLLGVLSALALVLSGAWLKELRPATKRGGQHPAAPFRIAGNFYYVGANDVAAFLITGPQGHVVLDAGYPSTARMIMASIAALGFDINDVKVLLNSEPHSDHGGGLAVLQQASGAELWASEASADVIASGGDDADILLPVRALFWIGLLRYPPRSRRPSVQRRRHRPCRANRGHRTRHGRPHTRLHLVVVPRPRRRPRAERRERVRRRSARRVAVSRTSVRPRAQPARAAEPHRGHMGDQPRKKVGPVP